jgi:hypothetical protein
MLGWWGLNEFLQNLVAFSDMYYLIYRRPFHRVNVLIKRAQILKSVIQMMNDWVHFEKLWRALKFILFTVNRKVEWRKQQAVL